jgi:hypothetical protein
MQVPLSLFEALWLFLFTLIVIGGMACLTIVFTLRKARGLLSVGILVGTGIVSAVKKRNSLQKRPSPSETD